MKDELIIEALQNPYETNTHVYLEALKESESKDKLLCTITINSLRLALANGRSKGHTCWWSNTVITVEELTTKLLAAIVNKDYLSALTYLSMIMVKSLKGDVTL